MSLGMPQSTMPPGDSVDAWSEWSAHQTQLQAWVKDLRSRFHAVSPALAGWCGVWPEDMSGRTEARFFSPERVRQFRLDDLRVVALNQPVVVEESCARGRFATLKRPVRDGRGQVCGTVGIAYDWPRDRPRPTVPVPAGGSRPAPPWLRDMRTRMEHEFRGRLRVQQVAAEVGRHPNHISRAFRRHFGVSAVEWLHRLRVAWVAEVLLSGDHPLSAVAQRAGFADQAHLTRVFKRYYGLTPGQYRKASSLAQ
jgi:AraC-like DNA-binding protein